MSSNKDSNDPKKHEQDHSHEKDRFNKSEESIPLSKRESDHGYYNERGRTPERQNDDTTDHTGPRRKGNSNETE